MMEMQFQEGNISMHSIIHSVQAKYYKCWGIQSSTPTVNYFKPSQWFKFFTRVMSDPSKPVGKIKWKATDKERLWAPDLKLLAIEKIEGRGRVSFEHVNRPHFEIGLTYFGNVLVGKEI
jgi:hypothetical protein